MDKEKFHIPMPDERTIQNQINQIVAAGVKRNKSFPAYLKSMYHQVGIRHLFSDRSEFVFILFIAINLLSIFLVRSETVLRQVDNLYAFIFLISPVLFIALSVYTYSNKIMNTTYEVEMTCKYNVYQIIAFRMLLFSIISILVNSMTILFIVMSYNDAHFFRAFMISITGLFIFSIVFLYTLMKKHSTVIAAMTIIGWVLGNLLLKFLDNKFYSDILINLPLFVYGIVLIGSISFYIHLLKRLVYFKQTKGAF
ncbi:hypothetical protein [Aneurinibacillus aneurinilyticus]|uniref:Uncharacterized protein n=1 Tax=Aneurinibacillus aneurinilyticus ATCC 12856 TaxID=649747 RepID=U1WYT2_ANEAE|nr:hypothetical protein [Aneurinibacillus aneurinilyticus]ERI07433.1 hypothetical protein HMPREF0083_04495 [Aneurinibacillus aneurinilyticus ATCC 12856]MED0708993.1 hypothetical protein [Aneurinibacillus aneurinilyticus]MED0723047.1 hypothetical protein [Aneurinibacillus aneurinilyticus]MED0739915.1 hypothetical protein [Aneurinibacillus aneurinilyticus]